MATGTLPSGFVDIEPEFARGDTSGLGQSMLRTPSAQQVRTPSFAGLSARLQEEREREAAALAASGGGFLSAATGLAGDVLGSGLVQNIISGEEFINTIGGFIGHDELGSDLRDRIEEVPKVGNVLGFAFDVGAAPLTLLTAGLPGLSVAGRAGAALSATRLGRPVVTVGKGVFAPVIGGGRLPQRLASEIVVGTSAEVGADKYGIAGGIGAGLLGFRGIRAAQKGRIGREIFGEAATGAEAKARAAGRAAAAKAEQVWDVDDQAWVNIISGKQQLGDERLMRNGIGDFLGEISERGWRAVVGEGVKETFRGARSVLSSLTTDADNASIIIRAATRTVRSTFAPFLDGDMITFRKDLNIRTAGGALPGQPIDSSARLQDVLEFADANHAGMMPSDSSRYIRQSKYERLAITDPDELMYAPGGPGGVTAFPTPPSRVPGQRTVGPARPYTEHRVPVPDEVFDEVEKMRNVLQSITNEMDAHGLTKKVRPKTDLTFGQSYWPRATIKDIEGFGLDPNAYKGSDNFNRSRKFMTYEEGHRISLAPDSDFRYLDPFEALDMYGDQAFTAIKNTEFVRGLGMVVDSGDKPLSDELKARLGKAGENLPSDPTFAPGLAARLEKQFPSKATAGDPGRTKAILKNTAKVSEALKPLKASFDFSGAFVTVGMMAYNDPVLFAKALVMAFADTFSQKRVDEFLRSVRTRQAAGDITLIDPVDPKRLREQMGTGKMKRFTAPFDRNFAQMGNRVRVEMYHAAVDTHERAFRRGAAQILDTEVAGGAEIVDRRARREIGRALDRATGVSTGRPGDVERNLFFAPGFYRSMIETTTNAVADGGIEGDLARQYLGTFVSGALFLSAAAAISQGRNPAEVLTVFNQEALKRGDIRLNPNFASVRVGGRDVSLFGPWDSNARIIATASSTMTDFADTRDLKVLQDFLQGSARQKGSPAVSLLANIWTGETFTGKNFWTPVGVASAVLPFNVSAAIEDKDDDEDNNSILAGFFLNTTGMKERALSPTDRLNKITLADKRFGKLFSELSPSEKDTVLEEHPKIAASRDAQLARIDSPEAKFIQWTRDRREELRLEELRLHENYRADASITPEDFRRGIRRLRAAHYASVESHQKTMGVTFPREPGTAAAALGEFYDLYDRSKDGMGEINWDTHEENLNNLMSRIDRGEFGDADTARKFIQERRVAEVHPDMQWFEDNANTIRETKHSGYSYWEQTNRAFEQVRSTARRIAGHDIRNFSDLEDEMRRAEKRGDRRKARALGNLVSRVNSIRRGYRNTMRRVNPELDKALRENGYVTAKPSAGAKISLPSAFE